MIKRRVDVKLGSRIYGHLFGGYQTAHEAYNRRIQSPHLVVLGCA